MNRKTKIIATTAAALAAVGVAGGAYAAIPSTGTNVFHACVLNTGPTHTMYMLDKDTTPSCIAGYTEKTWNQTGPAGAAGVAGPAGAKGDKGDTGAAGADGASGALATVQVTVTDSSPVSVEVPPPAAPGQFINHYNPVAHCPVGYVATGGGWKAAMTTGTTNPFGGFEGPTTDGTGWQGKAFFNAATPQDVGVTVICALGTTS